MTLITCDLSLSLDGFVAGPQQSMDNPLGIGGIRLHEWAFRTESRRAQQGLDGGVGGADSALAEDIAKDKGAFIMGNNMFGGHHNMPDWRGWWGEEPPYHAPVFVLTQHPREPLEMRGGTTFIFVTDGIESALEQASAAAGAREVAIAGGPRTVDQYLAAGLIDELQLHIVPIVLGAGERLFAHSGQLDLEPISVVESPVVTHVRYRLARAT